MTDPEAKLYRKSSHQGADLYYIGPALMENCKALVIEATVTPANGTAEREAALAMVKKVARGKGKRQRITLGADKNYDTQEFLGALQGRKVTPHVAQNNTSRASSAMDGRTTRHEGSKVSQRIRKRVEEIFGWMKTVGNYRSPKYRGADREGWHFTLVAAAYNLVRMRNILRASPA
ncbi:hypothetical protein DESUT3_40800 [Desulfuromonas versatilis]|uniref:Transposase IS4-like domain-containing protein n=1 Tax=Desulfuromonas versatilis TaxID=2802975 RepID=A0ABN6E3T7_9BACT|nr:transposase [Desulfuromonas versatilis]BCR07011.1 hypothetical protein DESUT3_40800 [Desulfuromonas versatilis]